MEERYQHKAERARQKAESVVQTKRQRKELYLEQKLMKAFDRDVDPREHERLFQICCAHKRHSQFFQVAQQDVNCWFKSIREQMSNNMPLENEIQVVYFKVHVGNELRTCCLVLNREIYVKQ